MPSLASMRQLDPAGDSFQPLGPAVKPAAPAPAPPVSKQTGTPGVVQMPDGKLATNLPLPPQKSAARADDSVWFDDDYASILAASPESFHQEFTTDLNATTQRVAIFYEGTIGKLVADSFGTLTGRFRSENVNFSNEPKPAEREPKVGDWVRILSGQDGIEAINEMVGGIFQVCAVLERSDGTISITANNWCFRAPGYTHPDGSLLTEFAEPPL